MGVLRQVFPWRIVREGWSCRTETGRIRAREPLGVLEGGSLSGCLYVGGFGSLMCSAVQGRNGGGGLHLSCIETAASAEDTVLPQANTSLTSGLMCCTHRTRGTCRQQNNKVRCLELPRRNEAGSSGVYCLCVYNGLIY